MNYIKIFIATLLVFSTFFTVFAQDGNIEGKQVETSTYEKNLQRTRWELVDCSSNLNYKFLADGTFTQNGQNPGTYVVEDKNLTMTQGGKTQKYTITKMTMNVMHLEDAEGQETVYGRKLDLSSKLAGTHWFTSNEDSQTYMKFIDESNIESTIVVGTKEFKVPSTYTIDSETRRMTAVTQGIPDVAEGSTETLSITTFNFMMFKTKNDEDGDISCMRRIR